jgi:hypothetical protein
MKTCLDALGYGAAMNVVLRISCFQRGTIGKTVASVNTYNQKAL